jgi:two-component system chemotaxis response regulator CheY
MRVLVLEDSGTTRRILANMMRELGHEVDEASDGRVGLERLHDAPQTSLCLVDWNMPELDGIGFVRAVRADHAFDGVRLMMVTTEIEMAKVASALEAGADEYLMKPFTIDMVRDKLALMALVAH